MTLDEEKQQIITARQLGGQVDNLPPVLGNMEIGPGSTSCEESLSPSAMRLRMLRAMTKQAREAGTADPSQEK